jgi:REP element-mobilizing transposase RayT
MRAIKDIRLKRYDYHTDGYYFVTVICDQRNNLFKDKESLVEKELKDLQQKIPGLALDYFVIMPNHAHIIFIMQNCELALGEIVRRFKAKVSHGFGINVWQPNYYEHVIRNEKALGKIREYVINNPQEALLEFNKFYV